MYVALLPVWGRRYVNAVHPDFSFPVFDEESMRFFGEFLGDRYKSFPNIIWVLGGDVQADKGGDFLGHYRAMAEGILTGVTGEHALWNEPSGLWNYVLMTYHPDGHPYKNSSTWFHDDPWLDFNMIETHSNVNDVYHSIQIDYALKDPIKPTIMGEPGYELWQLSINKFPDSRGYISPLQIRRQAYQSIFAGAAGFTYGAHRDSLGNGPLFSPFNDWKQLLDLEGARSLIHLKTFCLENKWPDWEPITDLINDNPLNNELSKVGIKVKDNSIYLVYFPDNSEAEILLPGDMFSTDSITVQWYKPASGFYQDILIVQTDNNKIKISPPEGWSDAVVILKLESE